VNTATDHSGQNLGYKAKTFRWFFKGRLTLGNDVFLFFWNFYFVFRRHDIQHNAIKYNDTRHNNVKMRHSAYWHWIIMICAMPIMLNVVKLSVIMLNVVAPFFNILIGFDSIIWSSAFPPHHGADPIKPFWLNFDQFWDKSLSYSSWRRESELVKGWSPYKERS
jgi:hypothetical protein